MPTTGLHAIRPANVRRHIGRTIRTAGRAATKLALPACSTNPQSGTRTAMHDQLLWIEALIKLSAGCVLLMAPITMLKIFGLPGRDTALWARLLGATLAGMALAQLAEGGIAGSGGLGLAGTAVINITCAAALSVLLITNQASATRRGQTLLWCTVGLLIILSGIEIAVTAGF